MLRSLWRRTRQNHALEHATIAMLSRALSPATRLAGRSTPRGFYVYADLPTEAIRAAADEGLARLKAGERDLAISPFCGTNYVVAGLLAGIGALLVLGRRPRLDALPRVLLASTLGVLVGQSLGRLAQKHVTTVAAVDDLRIRKIERRNLGKLVIHHVETERA